MAHLLIAIGRLVFKKATIFPDLEKKVFFKDDIAIDLLFEECVELVELEQSRLLVNDEVLEKLDQ